MEPIIKYLNKYSNSDFLINNFSYKFPISDQIFESDERTEINSKTNWFDKNIYIKHLLSKKMKNNDPDSDYYKKLCFWIINDWGGIQSFKNNEKNIKRIKVSFKELGESRLSSDIFSVISSISKIFSFYDIEKYVIYDSRVIFALNWLILKYNLLNKDFKFFPQPDGRNRIIANFNICSLINYYYLCKNKNDKFEGLYYNRDESYFKYVNLIKSINSKIWKNDENNKYPFYTEIILFCLSEEIIINEIKEELGIRILNKLDNEMNNHATAPN